ncbi:transcriptional regulator [Exiguobacterium sp. SH3S2]|uniref:winged helix-turn-helix transcriptional regulator n=1 Tax=Exiguobacterium TaxID=33986 RepID=UPI0008779F4C|nr:MULTISPECIES: helix-turn-helix domain-containing protein [Exiguobacterium]OGX79465.1 HxlR family transcriptional regulator [Exiguobacterium sp. SH31]TCI24597.1 transcriptional regulator [Exiguobacterium sp. SH5S4]TCI36440.1 transcriptional regulator [Exiguobacterium sp. SH4S7]TCI44867.1 transcriptional regulator [Exiguobacterium sp. SH3S3]TCI48490.1 transcriptional regulator [Exiguobacterium sp. SH5S32]
MTTPFPVNKALDIIGGKWRPQVYCTLETGPRRFSEIQRAIPDVSRKVLTDQLRELEQLGMVRRDDYSTDKQLHVEYSLTEEAFSLQPAMKALCSWGETRDE